MCFWLFANNLVPPCARSMLTSFLLSVYACTPLATIQTGIKTPLLVDLQLVLTAGMHQLSMSESVARVNSLADGFKHLHLALGSLSATTSCWCPKSVISAGCYSTAGSAGCFLNTTVAVCDPQRHRLLLQIS